MTLETTERVFAVAADASLRLSNVRGTTEIAAAEDGKILVHAVRHLDTGNPEQTEIRIEQAGNGEVVVETLDRTKKGTFIRHQPCKVDYIVRVPRKCKLEVNGVTNLTRVGEIEGRLRFSTISGAIALKNLSGDLYVKSVSGPVQARGLAGRLNFETVSAAVEVFSSQLSAIAGSTISGGIVLETPLADRSGEYRFNSVSGDYRLVLPAGSGCVVELSSLSGHLRTTLETAGWRGSPSRGEFTLNGGGPLVYFQSVSGSLWVPAGQALEGEHPGSGSAQDISVLDLLQQIEEGQLSVDEALSRLA